MKKPLIAICLYTIAPLRAENALFQRMMQDRKNILEASQNPKTPDPFTSNSSDSAAPTKAPAITISPEMMQDEDTLNQELAALLKEAEQLPDSDSEQA